MRRIVTDILMVYDLHQADFRSVGPAPLNFRGEPLSGARPSRPAFCDSAFDARAVVRLTHGLALG